MIRNRDPGYTGVYQVKIVLVRAKTVLMRVKMAEVLIGEYVDSKNCIQCVKLRE